MSWLRESLAQYWLTIQGSLFPWLKEELGELTEKQRQVVAVLELVRVEEFLRTSDGWPGRPPADRTAIARAFVAKQVDSVRNGNLHVRAPDQFLIFQIAQHSVWLM